MVTFGYFWSCGPQDQKYTLGGGICRIFSTLYDYYQTYYKEFLILIFYFWSLLVTLGLLLYEMIYIYLHQKYTFGLVVHKTESNQKWPQVKYSGSKPFLDLADNNHMKLHYGKEKGGREEGRMLAETFKVSFFLTYILIKSFEP